ncbi:hypothetical protein [Pseudoclavibacter sp. JSM 162008]|uniref:hypothetical protein n=1 Tax=Pseudoclavibacter sp. JSM 162008 TaxID=3229855 RepID=UPI003525AACC
MTEIEQSSTRRQRFQDKRSQIAFMLVIMLPLVVVGVFAVNRIAGFALDPVGRQRAAVELADSLHGAEKFRLSQSEVNGSFGYGLDILVDQELTPEQLTENREILSGDVSDGFSVDRANFAVCVYNASGNLLANFRSSDRCDFTRSDVGWESVQLRKFWW